LASFDSGLNPFCFEDINNFWCVTSTDLVRMPAINTYHRIRPTPVLRGVKVLMQAIDFQEIKDFSYNQNYLTFDIEGIWLTNPQAVRFRYKLEKLDPDWQTTKQTTLTYPNLPAGKYTLRIQASLTDDFTGADETTYTFEISRPIWQKWWFILLTSLAVGGIFYFYVKKRENRLNQEATLKQDKIVAQLELLKSQISPHFLFNSFNTLIATIENDPQSAVEYTEHLSDFYRSILQVREKNVISLQDEKELLKNYIFLLQKRHGSTLITDIQIKSLDKNIVPLTLQLLVENAVKHNVVSMSRPLSISIVETADGFIEVKNNVQKKLNIEKGTGFGLSSLVSRYELLTDKKVEIIETDNTFLVRIPMV
jgi:cbb3-type cytochrome oxidase subunit 3